MSDDELHCWWQRARKLNPTLTFEQARRLASRFIAAKRQRDRRTKRAPIQ